MLEYLLGVGTAWRVGEALLDANSSRLAFNLEKTAWSLEDEFARAGATVILDLYVEPMLWRYLTDLCVECVIAGARPRGRRGDDGKVYRNRPALLSITHISFR